MAGKHDRSNSKRAAKKHEKAVKRKRALADRARPAPTPRLPMDGWRPARDGIEGLARRIDSTMHQAAALAEYLHRHHGRNDASAAWLPSRVAAMGVASVVAALAERGIVTDEASFRVLAREHLSARRLAELGWRPRLQATHDVHDRDFTSEAAEYLWAEWSPDIQSDEQAEDGLNLAERAATEFDGDDVLNRLLRVWEGFPLEEAARRLHKAGLHDRFVELAARGVEDGLVEDDLDPDLAAGIRAALRRLQGDVDSNGATPGLLDELLVDLDWYLGDGDVVLTRLLDKAHGDPATLIDAAALLLRHFETTDAQLTRVRGALAAAVPTADGEVRSNIENFLQQIDESLHLRASESPDRVGE